MANALAAICCGGRLTNTMLGCLRPRLPRNCISAENYLRKRFCPSKSMLKFLFITNHFEAESVVFKSDGVTCCYANHLDWRSNLWIHGQPTKSPELLYCSWNITKLVCSPSLVLGRTFCSLGNDTISGRSSKPIRPSGVLSIWVSLHCNSCTAIGI